MLTVAYITNRREPNIEWFFDSFRRECRGDFTGIRIVVVDFWRDEDGRKQWMETRAPKDPGLVVHVSPKPNVWQGKYRLTKQDYFAASNARNTALCCAFDGYIAYVDDISVLMPGWLSEVRRAESEGVIYFGAYMKVKNLSVADGVVLSREAYGPGVDSRWYHGSDFAPVPAGGGWLYGCSVAAPVESFLNINGWDEDADSLGSEDYIAGIMLERKGYKMFYSRRMLTLESEELHHIEPAFKRMDKGQSPKDKSHAILNMVVGGRNAAPNYFGAGGIRAVRERVLRGEDFPVCQVPQHDWYDGQPISEF